LGKPPVLPHEDPEIYQQFWLEIAKSIGPTDFIEWLLIKDILDLSWEIRRLRGFKAGLAEKCRRDRIGSRGARNGDSATAAELSEVESDASVASRFVEDMSRYERIDELLATQESRRNAVSARSKDGAKAQRLCWARHLTTSSTASSPKHLPVDRQRIGRPLERSVIIRAETQHDYRAAERG
jgi:hypothetical protein